MKDFEAINNAFDHIYVLTLARAKDRQELFEQNFKGLDFEFFFGVDRREINFDNKDWKGTEKDLLSFGIDLKRINKIYERKGGTMHPGEVACSLGHLGIYKDMVSRGFQKVLILEDDALMVPDRNYNVSEILSAIPQNWDLVYLGFKGNQLPQKKKLKTFFYEICHYLKIADWNKIPVSQIKRQYSSDYNSHWLNAGEHFCTHAYAVSQPFAKRMIEMQTPIQYISDRLLTFALLKDYQFKGYSSKSNFIGQLEDFQGFKSKSYINTD